MSLLGEGDNVEILAGLGRSRECSTFQGKAGSIYIFKKRFFTPHLQIQNWQLILLINYPKINANTSTWPRPPMVTLLLPLCGSATAGINKAKLGIGDGDIESAPFCLRAILFTVRIILKKCNKNASCYEYAEGKMRWLKSLSFQASWLPRTGSISSHSRDARSCCSFFPFCFAVLRPGFSTVSKDPRCLEGWG